MDSTVEEEEQEEEVEGRMDLSEVKWAVEGGKITLLCALGCDSISTNS